MRLRHLSCFLICTICAFLSSNALALVTRLQPTEPHQAHKLSVFSSSDFSTVRWNVPWTLLSSDSIFDSLNQIDDVSAIQLGDRSWVSQNGSSLAGQLLAQWNGLSLEGTLHPFLLIPTENLNQVTIEPGAAGVVVGPGAANGAINFQSRTFSRASMGAALGGLIAPWRHSLSHSLQDSSALLQAPLVSGSSHLQLSLFTQTADAAPSFMSTRSDQWTNRLTLSGGSQFSGWKLTGGLIAAKEGNTNSISTVSPEFATRNFSSLAMLKAEKRFSHKRIFYSRIAGVFENSRYQLIHSGEVAAPGLLPTGQEDSEIYRAAVGWKQPILTSLNARFLSDFSLQNANINGTHLYQRNADFAAQFSVPVRGWKANTGVRFVSAVGQWLTNLRLERRTPDITWISFSEGIHIPTLQELAGGDEVRGNPSLQPQHSQTLALGYWHEPNSKFIFTRSGWLWGGRLFSTDYLNRIEWDNSSGTLQAVNDGLGTVDGAELSLGYAKSIWTVALSGDLLDSKDQTTKQNLIMIPSHEIRLRASCQLGPIVTELRALHWGPYDDQEIGSHNRVAMSPWTRLDLTFHTLGFSHWNFEAGLINVTNVRAAVTYDAPLTGRRFYISAQRYF